ncbi:DHHW family protein [Cohnella sp. GCM10012308]|uniref:DHHW family protein n=1 Tax=Cohnella sp. GCM10012308 TaxID=3317329 RepID=UPI0036174A21
MDKKTSVIYIFFFLTIVGGFALVSLCMPDRGSSAIENRNLSQWPAIRAESVTTRHFFVQLNDYFNDQIVLRDGMVKLYQRQQNAKLINALLLENLLHPAEPGRPEDGTRAKSLRTVSKLMIINNKWILPTPDQIVHTERIDESTVKLNETVRAAEEQHTETFFIFNPSRTKSLMHLYPAYLQTDAYAQSKSYFLSKLDKSVNVIDIEDRFGSYTKSQLEEMYLETDHHWNIKGAFNAYQEMIEQLSARSAQFEDKPLSIDRIDVSQLAEGRFEGSLNTQINGAVNMAKADRTILYSPEPPFSFTRFAVVDKDGRQTVKSFDNFYGFKPGRSTYTYGSIYGGDRRQITYVNEAANNRLNVLLIKDSYMNPITPYLARHFYQLTVYDSRYYPAFSLQSILKREHYDMLLIAFHDDNLFSDTYNFEKG